MGPCSSRPREASTLHPAGVGWLLSLIHFSPSSFPFLPLPWVLVPARSRLLKHSESLLELRVTPETLRALFRDAGSAGNAHAYGAECLVTGWTPGDGSEPDSTAVLRAHPEQKTVFLSFEFLTEAVLVPLRVQLPQRVTLRLCLDRRENDQKRIWPML